jgi:hypothetical protein
MADDPVVTVQLNGAEALFMLGAQDDARHVENVDVEVVLDDGSRWSATFLSVAEIGRLMKRWEATGEYLDGAYLRVPDLIVVRHGGVEGMVAVLNSILATGDPGTALIRIDIEE